MTITIISTASKTIIYYSPLINATHFILVRVFNMLVIVTGRLFTPPPLQMWKIIKRCYRVIKLLASNVRYSRAKLCAGSRHKAGSSAHLKAAYNTPAIHHQRWYKIHSVDGYTIDSSLTMHHSYDERGCEHRPAFYDASNHHKSNANSRSKAHNNGVQVVRSREHTPSRHAAGDHHSVSI